MINIPLSDYGGKDFEIHEWEEMPLRIWELASRMSMPDSEYDFLDFIKEGYGIPKHRMRVYPRVILDHVEDQYANWMEQANLVDTPEIDQKIQDLPYHKWQDLEAKLKASEGNPATFIKYMMVIALEDYELDNLELKAQEKNEMMALEGIAYLLFFCMNDQRFMNLINLYIPMMSALSVPLMSQMPALSPKDLPSTSDTAQ